MNVLFISALVDIAIVLVVVAGVYLINGNGLATRMFALLAPIIAIIGFTGFAMAMLGLSLTTVFLGTAICAVFATVGLYALYRIVVTRLDVYCESLADQASQLTAAASQSSATVSQQTSAVAQVTASVAEISQMADSSAESLRHVAGMSKASVDKSKIGIEAVATAIKTMEKISTITNIVDTVNELADQSNVLAVNASIESAQAGEHGRGFAVVASEMRNLAEQTKNAAASIRAAILSTKEGHEAIDGVERAIQDLAQTLQTAADEAMHISSSSIEQLSAIRQINDSMRSIEQGSQDTAANASQLMSAVNRLTDLSKNLRHFIRSKDKRAGAKMAHAG